MAVTHGIALPALPATHRHRHSTVISPDQLTRKRLQSLLHLITADLKKRGTKTPHVFLPFRLKVDDTKLEMFLRRVFPHGTMVDTSNTMKVQALLKEFDEFTLICALKYLWCRLPNNEIIGWNVYLEFKRREQEAGYPKDAFLTIMPKCLSSSSHASIVYDFLDLLIGIASNSQYNHLSGRKISKMASLWAFNRSGKSTSAFYDATIPKENTFLEGLEAWKSSCNGLFHLLLSFLRAMLPDTEAEALNLPKTLQTLLISNTYPPPENTSSVKSAITIPCVLVRSTTPSADPYELISKVRHTLRFDKKDSFLSIENYTILKNIFQKDSTNAIVSTLTEESRRVLTRLSAEPIDSDYQLYPGWARTGRDQDPNIPNYADVSISNVTLQDYYIWTWLSSLASDQVDNTKALFGRSIVVEAGLRGFQKWLIISETTMLSDDYVNSFRPLEQSHEVPGQDRSVTKDLPLPPPPKKNDYPPPPIAKDGYLPEVTFQNDQFSLEELESPSGYNHFLSNYPEDDQKLAQDFHNKVKVSAKKQTNRPRPPPLELEHSNTERLDIANRRSPNPQRRLPKHRGASPHRHREPSPSRDRGRSPQPYPEYQAYLDYVAQEPEPEFHEPYETYKTPFDKNAEQSSREPFDDYNVPGEERYRSQEHLRHHGSRDRLRLARPLRSPRRREPSSAVPRQEMNGYANEAPYEQPYESNAYDSAPTHQQDPYAQDYGAYPQEQPPMDTYQQGAYYDNEEPMPPPPEKEKKKKKKKKKSRKDPEFDLDNLPDGPPPPIPPLAGSQGDLPLIPSGYIPAEPHNGHYEQERAYEEPYQEPNRIPKHLRPNYPGSQEALPIAKPKEKKKPKSSSPRHREQAMASGSPEDHQHQAIPEPKHHHQPPQQQAYQDPYQQYAQPPTQPVYQQPPPKSLSPHYPPQNGSAALLAVPGSRNASQSPSRSQVQPVANLAPPPGQQRIPSPQMMGMPFPGQPMAYPGTSPYGQTPPGQPGMPVQPLVSTPTAPHGQPVPGQPVPGQPVPGQQMPAGQPVPGQQMPPGMPYYYPPPPGQYMPYGYPPQPMYYPPPQGYFPPPQQQQPQLRPKAKPTTSELTMMNMPSANTFKKNTKPNKAGMRAALNQGFGL